MNNHRVTKIVKESELLNFYSKVFLVTIQITIFPIATYFLHFGYEKMIDDNPYKIVIIKFSKPTKEDCLDYNADEFIQLIIPKDWTNNLKL